MPKYNVTLKPIITIKTIIDTDDLDGEAGDQDSLRGWIEMNLDSVSDFAEIIDGNSPFECVGEPDVTLSKVEISDVKADADEPAETEG